MISYFGSIKYLKDSHLLFDNIFYLFSDKQIAVVILEKYISPKFLVRTIRSSSEKSFKDSGSKMVEEFIWGSWLMWKCWNLHFCKACCFIK